MKKQLLYGVLIWTLALPSAGADVLWQAAVRHDHRLGSCRGALRISSEGIEYQAERRKHAQQWSYQDLKLIRIAPTRLRLATYGTKPFKLQLTEGQFPEDVVRFLLKSFQKTLVVKAAILPAEPLFEIPVAHRHRRGVCQGRLRVGQDTIVLESSKALHSRTWRYQDVVDISSAGPHDLTITTQEHQRFRYAGNRVFRFRLKEPLPADAYHDLWRKVNRLRTAGSEPQSGPEKYLREATE